MLTFFPTPYDGEWWYSVLCRYHVRSGSHNHQTTIKELFRGKPRAAMGTLFPNSTIHQIISQFPSSWDCREIILEHTLFPYYSRMYNVAQKETMLSALCNGESVSPTHIWRTTTKKAWSLRYCPICVQKDIENYGEPYWHREHQLPLVSVCNTHHCILQPAGELDPRLNEAFYPLSMVEITDIQKRPIQHWEEPLSAILTDYLTLPLDVGPTEGHNNLAQTLMNQGYGVVTSGSTMSLDASTLYQNLIKSYGSTLVQDVFGNEISAFVLNRIVKWNLTSPERYVLLQYFAGLPTASMFSETPVEDLLYKQLADLEKNCVIYGKKALAEKLGLKPFQLDTLAKRYGIKPFWEQNGLVPEKKTDMLKLYLTPEEREGIHQSAQKLGFRYDTHFVKFCISKAMQNQGK